MTEPIGYKFVVNTPRFNYDTQIRKLKCLAETDSHAVLVVAYSGRPHTDRMRKAGRVFDTWAEAHAALLARAQDRLDAARLELQLARGHHGNVAGMTEPTDA